MRRVFLELQQLNLDLENPRLPIPRPTSLNGALDAIVSTQRDKLYRLAEDIVEQGLAPGEALYVLPTSDPDVYTVLEGNRRTAALKLLDNPVLDGELPYFSAREGRPLLKRFQALRPLFDRSLVDPLFCVVCPNRDAAAPWLRRRHAGELDGVGISRWNSFETERARNPNSPVVSLVEYLRDEGLTDEEDQTLQRQFTTVERVIDTPSARAKLGLGTMGGVLCSLVGPDATNRMLRALLEAISATTAPSRVLNKSDAIEKFVSELPPELLPDPSTFGAPVALKSLREHHERRPPGGQSEPPKPSPPSPPGPQTPPARRPPSRRRTIFKRGEVNAREDRARELLEELTSIPHATHPTAVTALFRIFLERSVRQYVAKHAIEVPRKSGHEKISDFVVKSFEHYTAANPTVELAAMKRLVRAGLTPHHVDILNRVVHDQFAFASTADIENIANAFRDFLIALWNDMT